MLDAVTAPDTPDNYGLLRVALRWNQDTHRPPDDLLSQVTEQPLRTLVPACDNAIEVFTDDCVITELDNRSKPPKLLLTFAQSRFHFIALNEVRSLSGKHVQWLQFAFRGVMPLSPVGRNHAQ